MCSSNLPYLTPSIKPDLTHKPGSYQPQLMPQQHQQLQKHHPQSQNAAEPDHEQDDAQHHRQDPDRHARLLERIGIGIVCICGCSGGVVGFVRGRLRLRLDVQVLRADERRALAGRGGGGAFVVGWERGFRVRGGTGGVLGFEVEGRHGCGCSCD
ncbi:hypothetical protein K449DRAFT_148284 [Hypoxylon sp. EC38]|nr:hypothetical protein K449DRAFT_148284 [Hypoxylon sp. EC38]